MKTSMKALIDKYENNTISEDEMVELEEFIESGELDWKDLPGMRAFDTLAEEAFFDDISMPENRKMDILLNELKGFENIENAVPQRKNNLKKEAKVIRFSGKELLKIASILLFGVAIGMLLNRQPNNKEQLTSLTHKMSDLKFNLMSSLLEQPAAQERLKAVKLTTDFKAEDIKVTNALLNTLRHDENVNVRLAALDVLSNYSGSPVVREGLIHSIKFQESPLVQIRLAELMSAIQAKEALQPFNEWMDDQHLPQQFKNDFEKHIRQIKSATSEM